MKLEDLVLGKTYGCKLSGQEMLVVNTQKPTTQAPDSEMEDCLAGKYCIDINGIPTFKMDELADGQLEEITD